MLLELSWGQALRERREDVGLLVQHFLQIFAVEMGIAPPEINPQALAVLARGHRGASPRCFPIRLSGSALRRVMQMIANVPQAAAELGEDGRRVGGELLASELHRADGGAAVEAAHPTDAFAFSLH